MTHANDIYKDHSNRLKKPKEGEVDVDGKKVDQAMGTTNFEEKVQRFKSQYNR